MTTYLLIIGGLLVGLELGFLFGKKWEKNKCQSCEMYDIQRLIAKFERRKNARRPGTKK